MAKLKHLIEQEDFNTENGFYIGPFDGIPSFDEDIATPSSLQVRNGIIILKKGKYTSCFIIREETSIPRLADLKKRLRLPSYFDKKDFIKIPQEHTWGLFGQAWFGKTQEYLAIKTFPNKELADKEMADVQNNIGNPDYLWELSFPLKDNLFVYDPPSGHAGSFKVGDEQTVRADMEKDMEYDENAIDDNDNDDQE